MYIDIYIYNLSSITVSGITCQYLLDKLKNVYYICNMEYTRLNSLMYEMGDRQVLPVIRKL